MLKYIIFEDLPKLESKISKQKLIISILTLLGIFCNI